MRNQLLQPTIPKCRGGYNGLIPLFCKQCKGSRYYSDDVILTVSSLDAQELLEVLCSIPQEVEMGEWSDGEPHRPSCVDSLIDQLVKYTMEDDVSIQEFEILPIKEDDEL